MTEHKIELRYNDIPRRARIDLFVPAEKAIFEAIQVVEAMPPDVRLTHAVNKLAEARALVADYVDGVPYGEGYPRAGFAQPHHEWHEDDGPVLWWRFPVTEPPYVGTPLDDDFPDEYVTHWTRIVVPHVPEGQ